MATMASLSSIEASTQEEDSYRPTRPRRFAPLNPEKAQSAGDLPKLRGIVFDVDGTLCLPQNYMFREMRAALSIPKSVDILTHLHSLSPTPDTPDSSSSSPRSRATDAIRAIERTAMTAQTPQPGLVELMTYLDRRGLRRGLCTRNFPAPVRHLVDAFLAPHGVTFADAEVVTRETPGVRPKPSPEGIWRVAAHWFGTAGSGEEGADPLEAARRTLGAGLIMVGDSVDDMAAGYRAGAATVLLLNEDNRELAGHEWTDLAVEGLEELVGVLEAGFVGRDG